MKFDKSAQIYLLILGHECIIVRALNENHAKVSAAMENSDKRWLKAQIRILKIDGPLMILYSSIGRSQLDGNKKRTT